MLDETKVKTELVNMILEYSALINHEIVKADFKVENINKGRIRNLGMNIADSANVAMGTQRLDNTLYEFRNYKSIILISLYEISSILQQTQCIETRVGIEKVIRKMEVKLLNEEFEKTGEIFKPSVGSKLENLKKEFERDYNEKVE